MRMLITVWFNLWATRLLLVNLGETNLGIWGVIAGIVSYVSIFTGITTTALQNFLSLEIGKPGGNPQKVYATSFNLVMALSIVLWIVLAVVGQLLVSYGINIPESSKRIASIAFQLSLMTSIAHVFRVTFDAMLISHEKLGFFAVSQILTVLTQWLAAYVLIFINFDDRIVFYALFLVISQVSIVLVNWLYCRFTMADARYQPIIDKQLSREIGKFVTITTASNACYVVKEQGLILTINWFYGLALNAVYLIAFHLRNTVLSFSLNIYKAVSPQITKTYAEGDMKTHQQLVYAASKMETYMMFFIIIPFLIRTDYFMILWLKEKPDYIIPFARSIIFISLVYSLFEPIRSSVYATKNIKRFLLVPDLVHIAVIFPTIILLSYFLHNPIVLIVSVVLIEFLVCALRTYIASTVTMLELRKFISKVIIPVAGIFFISFTLSFFANHLFPQSLLGVIVFLMFTSATLLVSIWMVGLTKSERAIVTGIAKRITSK